MVTLNYRNQANEPGIYVIFNSQKWRVYVGQAKRFKERWYDHIKSLRNNKHSNKFLQNDWNQCGEEAFEFHVLEVMPGSSKEERNLKEEHWIEIHWDKQEQCYNFKKKTEGKERSCYSNTPEETRKKLSEAMKGKVRSKEHRENLSKALKGKKVPQEVREKISSSQRGRKQSLEIVRKRAEKLRGQKRSEEIRKVLSMAAKNRKSKTKRTETSKKKQSETMKKIWRERKAAKSNNRHKMKKEARASFFI